MNLTPIITSAGLSAVLNQTNDGLSAKIVSIALGDAAWEPDNTATALQNEITRVPVTGSTRVNPTQIHVTAIESGEVDYWVREIGFILDDGTLLAVWSQPDSDRALAYKAASVDLLLGFDLLLSALPADSVIVEDTGGLNLGPATATVAGVVRLATEAEVLAGRRDDVALSPSTAAALIQPATSQKKGTVRLATPEEALTGESNEAVMTPRMVAALGNDRYQQRLTFGEVQLTDFLNQFDESIDYVTPPGTVMVGLASLHDNRTEDRRWRVRYQSIGLASGPVIIR